ncbi:uncharacterized protein LY89DRAFT_756393 [Mollisia scopiformis]|uniref:Uncharacterized protein n=1 Tax=Mollisia scopiformis TaxID=149040 RepID=A0A194WYN7_MOLSC|nr:uncharacterized protein LY89DRAFT_756393 [Mollisia scopiformis]KUJ13060.1 hypothetical protein LY89DRAFT_756393 [Mollisia scopiformis]
MAKKKKVAAEAENFPPQAGCEGKEKMSDEIEDISNNDCLENLFREDTIREVEDDDRTKYLHAQTAETVGLESMTASIAAVSITSIAADTSLGFMASKHSFLQSTHTEVVESEPNSSFPPKSRAGKGDFRTQSIGLQHQLDKKEKELKGTKQRVVAVEANLEASKEESQSLKARIKVLETERSKMKTENRQLRTQVGEHTKVVATLKAQHKEDLRASKEREEADSEMLFEALRTKNALTEARRILAEQEFKRSTIMQLQTELAQKTAANLSLRNSLVQAEQNRLQSENQCTIYEQAYDAAQKELAQEREESSKWYDTEQALRRMNADISNQLVQEQQNHRKTKVRLRIETTCLRQTERAQSSIEMDRLAQQEQVAELKQKLEGQQPLVNVGVAIRLRYLEKERALTYGLSGKDLDKNLIKEGNIAAHQPDGEQDAALFICNLVPAENSFDMSEIYEELYGTPPPDSRED